MTYRTGLVLSALAAAGAAQATDIQVPADQPTIQEGIAAAQDGDRVLVAPGTYFEHVNFIGRNIAVIGTGGSAVTTIDGSGTDTVVRIELGETSAVLQGFTIAHGAAPDGLYGGGISVASGATPTIEDNDITGNVAYSGGGIGMVGGGGRIRDNHFHGNSVTQDGGGIFVLGNKSAMTIEGNLVENNASSEEGAGMELDAEAQIVVARNVIRHNTSPNWAGAHLYRGRTRFVDNLVHHNHASNSGGGVGAYAWADTDRIEVVNNTFANNDRGDLNASVGAVGHLEIANNILFSTHRRVDFYCYAEAGADVTISRNLVHTTGRGTQGDCDFTRGGLLGSDPMFVGGPAPHAYWLSPGSPAIDAGDNDAAARIQIDLSGAARIVNGTVDLGAYEFRGE